MMHSILLIGQSNMGGRGFKEEVEPIVNDKLYVLRNGRWRAMYVPVNPDRVTSGINLSESFADLYAKRVAYPELLQQMSAKTASVKYWFSEFSPLINYDVDAYEIDNKGAVPGTKLLDIKGNRGRKSSSAINDAPENVENSRKPKEPMVTAVYMQGYIAKPVDSDGQAQYRAFCEHILSLFDERNADSLFAYENSKVESNLKHYFHATTSKEDSSLPSYVVRVHMVMPLKKPIPVPDNTYGKK